MDETLRYVREHYGAPHFQHDELTPEALYAVKICERLAMERGDLLTMSDIRWVFRLDGKE